MYWISDRKTVESVNSIYHHGPIKNNENSPRFKGIHSRTVIKKGTKMRETRYDGGVIQ